MPIGPASRWDVMLTLSVAAAVCDVCPDQEIGERDILLIRTALPHVSNGPTMMRLRETGAALVAAWPSRRTDGRAWARAHLDAGEAVARVLRWRAAELHRLLTVEDSGAGTAAGAA